MARWILGSALGTVILLALFIGAGVNAAAGLILGVLVVIVILLRPLWGLALTIFTNVLSPLLGQFDFSGLGLTLPRVAGALTAASWLLQWVVRRSFPPLRRHMIALLGFLAVVALSVLTKPDRAQSMIGAYLVFVGVLMYLLVATLPRNRGELLLVIAVIWCVGLVSSSIGLVQYVFPDFQVLQNTEGGLDVGEGAVVDEESVSSGPIRRVTGGLGDANNLAFTLVTVMPLTMFFWLLPEARGLRWLVIAIVLIQLAGLGLTYSRSGLISLAAAVAVLTWKKRLPLSVVGPAAVVSVMAAIILLPGFRERMFSVGYLKEGSTQIRKDILSDTLIIVRENWPTGIGYGQLGPLIYGEPRSEYAQEMAGQIDLESPEVHNMGAHNIVLEVAVEYGVIGLLPYLAFLGLLLWEVDRLSRSPDPFISDIGVCLLAGFAAFLTCGMFGHGKTLKVFWLLAGIAVAVSYLQIRWSSEEQARAVQPELAGTSGD